MKKQRYTLFSNGTEFMLWQDRNCARCIKAVGGDAKYRCAIQEHIEYASVTDGTGNKRDYEATQCKFCPFLQTERKPRRKKQDKAQLTLF